MAISLADIKKLRDMTSAGMMDCKKALEEAAGEFKRAVEILREKGKSTLAKRERLQVERQRAKLEKNLGSIRDMSRLPSALFVVDVQKEANAVKEAVRLNIPVIAMVDTCCDPTPIDYVIPANDDAAKSIELITDVLCAAIQEGLNERKLEKEKEAEAAPAAPPRPRLWKLPLPPKSN